MAMHSSRTFGAFTMLAVIATALPSRAAVTLPGTVVERGGPVQIAACNAEADEVTFVPHVEFSNQLAKPVVQATVNFGFVDSTGAPLVHVAVVIPATKPTNFPLFPAGARGVTCALDRATFRDGTTYAVAPPPAGPNVAAAAGAALVVGGLAAAVAGHRGTSGAAAPGDVLPPAPPSTTPPGATPTSPASGQPMNPTPVAPPSPPPTATPMPGPPPPTPGPGRTASPAPL
ncbi:MAG: hypothetical protein NVS2B8_07500 [Vulcanimicrobiaceae bacterium]